jgi:hypothetical protein
MAKNDHEIKALQVRLSERLRRKLEASARKHEVSMNSEIVGRLEGSYDEEQQNLDYRAMVTALSGGGENAQLLAMLASALQLSTGQSKDRSSPEAMDTFLLAMDLIVRAHSGRPIDPVNAETILDMPDVQHRGYLVADAILWHHDLPRPVYIPKELQKEIDEQESNGMSLANLGRGAALDYIGRSRKK